MAAMTGTVWRLIPDKGFGFIKRDGDDLSYFFHRSVVVGGTFVNLREGQRVRFEEEFSSRGPRAGQVVVEP